MPVSRPADLRQEFDDLTSLLSGHKALWTESAFVQNELSWQATHPRLYQELLALSEGEVQRLEREDDLILALTPFLPDLAVLDRWSPSTDSTRPAWRAPEAAAAGVPGRKMAQIEGFVGSLLDSAALGPGDNVVDWCSGKGLLSRALHLASGAPVVCLERTISGQNSLDIVLIVFPVKVSELFNSLRQS